MDRGPVIGAHIAINDLMEAEIKAETPPRRFYKPESVFNLSDRKFVKCFGLNKNLVCQLIYLVTPFVRQATRASDITIERKVLIALRLYGFGSYQEITGTNLFTTVSQPSVSRCLHEITSALNRPELLNQFVQFLQNIMELWEARTRFYEKYEFPGLLGVIDCTHVAIVPPSCTQHPEYVYVNRKQYHLLNVQLVCDERLRILNVNCRYPCSCHDTYIWESVSGITSYGTNLPTKSK